jgi:hypothetical protein
MLVTESGMKRVASWVQYRKALLPMLMTESGITRDVKPEQL